MLTIPCFENLEKAADTTEMGKMMYSDVFVSLNMIELLEDLEVSNDFKSVSIRVLPCFFIKGQEELPGFTGVALENDNFPNNMKVKDFKLFIPQIFMFDFPHAKAQTIQLKVELLVDGTVYYGGLGKYSLEELNENNLNFLCHKSTVKIFFRTRCMGECSFSCNFVL